MAHENAAPTKRPGCDAVNQHIARVIPNRLWHYTTFRGFHGIFTSKTIWATEYRFLNDREEFLHGKRIAQELIDEEPQHTGLRFPARDILRRAVDIAFNTGPLHESRLRIMVASFTEEGDQLSQWRGYADDSTGVSMGLDLRGIRPPAEAETTVTFAPCIYEDSEKRAILKAAFAHHQTLLKTWWDSVVDATLKTRPPGAEKDPNFSQKVATAHSKELAEIVQQSQTHLLYDLMRIAPLLKHESFSEEKEWRLVLPSESIQLPTLHKIEFRPIRDAVVPYIAFPLLLPNQEGPIPCYDLILGPGSHPNAEVGVNLLFQSQYVPIMARPSKVPYRPA